MSDTRIDDVVRALYRGGIHAGAAELLSGANSILEFWGEDKIHNLGELDEWLDRMV